jgi:CheY-like chemotaxis protein
MTTAAARRSPLLGVAWGVEGVCERTTAIELTESTAFVMTESLPPVGAEVDLDLRFAKRAPVRVRGLVTQVRLSIEPGVPAGFAVTFEGQDAAVGKLAGLVSAPGHGASKTASRPLRVLHVEKNPLLRDMFAYAVNRYFAARSLRVDLLQADGLAAARSSIEAGALDALLVDHDTADVTGDEIARYARTHAGERCWIVGIGVDGQASRDRMLAAGADIYLRKPLVLRDLLYSMELLFQEDPNDGLGLGAA